MREREVELDLAAWESAHNEARIPGKMPAPEFIVYRSRDYAALRTLAVHPRIFPQITDDFTQDPKEWKPQPNEAIMHLLAKDERGLFGFGVFIPRTHIQYEAHMGFLPRSYGQLALASFKEMFRWMWANTQARRIVGEIVRENKLAIRFTRRAGCEVYGINPKSFLRGGKLRDQFCVGISKPE